MRKSVVQNGIILKAYAGTTGVLLAFNLKNDADRAGLLGFAVQRDGGQFLPAMIPFPGQVHEPGQPITTDKAPVQKFRWSDYTVDAATTYKYSVFAVRGTPTALVLGDGADITITTEPRSAATVIGNPDNFVTVSNRAVAASQAFSRQFPVTTQKLNAALAKGATTKDILTALEMKWLSNGLLEEVIAFITLAKDKTFALDVAIYQYELADVVNAIDDAANKAGAMVRLIYHAKPKDAQTAKNIASAKGLPATATYGRVTQAIFHHKFIVLSSVEGTTKTPIAVLCGSTNFTSNAVYSQANNVQITSNPVVMKHYVDQFEFLFDQPAHTPSVTAVQDTEQNILDASAPLQVGFSPRNGRADLNYFATLINAAKQDVLFATAFGLDKVILGALEGQPHDSILRYGIQDKPTADVTGLHGDRTADFEAASTLPTGLDGWLAERRTPGALGNILIHDKIIVVDFTSDTPVVINGSHNYSENASAHNDENYLIVRGNTSMADCLGVEVLRLYDHYRFRFVATTAAKAKPVAGATLPVPMTLHPDDSWTNAYYDATNLKYADRMVFSGMLHGGTTPPPPPGGTAAPAASVQQVRSMAGAAGTASAAATSAKVETKKAAVKKAVTKKAAKKAVAKKAVKKAVAKKAVVKKAANKVVAKGTTARNATVKKVAAKKSPLNNVTTKKIAAKKIAVKESTKK